MTSEIKNLIEEREWRDSRLGYLKHKVIATKDNISIIQRKSFYGIMDETGKYLFPPIYDDIQFLGESGLVCISVLDKKALFSINQEQIVVDFECDDVILYDSFDTIEFIISGKHGLWSNYESRVIIPACYDEITCHSDCQYLWAFNESHYCFIEKATGRVINISNALNVYDTEEGMFMQFGETQNVVYLDHDGFRDSVYLRRLVRKNNGRLILRNSKKEIKHIIDIYGRILN